MKPAALQFEIQKQVADVLRRPEVPVSNSDVREVASLVTNQIAPAVAFQTNNEPWYRSYVTLGSLGSVITAVGTLVTAFASGDLEPEVITPSITVILTALFALYGRWRATRPIGQ